MAVELLDEREEAVEAFPRLAFTAPARDIEAELEEAKSTAYRLGYQQAHGELTAEYNHQLSKRMPRTPLAAEMIPVMEKIAMILGIRVMLFVALVATFALAWTAMKDPQAPRLILVGMFGAIALGPLAWLAHRRSG